MSFFSLREFYLVERLFLNSGCIPPKAYGQKLIHSGKSKSTKPRRKKK